MVILRHTMKCAIKEKLLKTRDAIKFPLSAENHRTLKRKVFHVYSSL